jgi:membrane fusion protein, multidrug efflux system
MTQDSVKLEVSSWKPRAPSLRTGYFTLQTSNFTLLGLLLVILASCSRAPRTGTASQPPGPPAVPVTVGKAVEKTIPVQLEAVGRVQAYATVSVKSRVDGLVTSGHFKDGQFVNAGDLLFTLDATPYEAQLKQAQANRARDQAQLENARKQMERNASVVAKGYVSQEQYDQAVASAAALAATVKADEAAIETAQLQVQYCSIVSPITGRAGAVQVDVGNLIKANDATGILVVINQIQPIYVSFYVPQDALIEVRKHMASGPLPTEATVPGHEDNAVRGELAFLDNTVNTSSGTIQLRATFANENRWLWPGQFTNVVLTLTSQPNAVVVPSQAVQTGQQGQYVFVVQPDQTVKYRPITVGTTVGNETVIEKGVRPGESVVTDGQLRLSDGAPVRIVPPVAGATPEIRSSKSEIRNTSKIQSSNDQNVRPGRGRVPSFAFGAFVLVSDFEFRISNFRACGGEAGP